MIKEKQWECVVCGYIHKGDTAPDSCPICGVGSEQFEEIVETTNFSSDYNGKILIIGSGAAGYYAAKAIRERNSICNVEIISKDTILPYFKPMLSDYLSEDIPLDKLMIAPEQWYKDNNITLTLGKKILNLDTNNKKAILEDSTEINYDKVILATGSNAFIPPVNGSNKENIVTLRTFEDAEKIKSLIKTSQSVAVIGGGLLGIEAAYELSSTGIKVTIIERSPWVMNRQLDERTALLLQQLMENNNVQILTSTSTQEILGEEKVTGVKLESETIIECDFVLFSAGVRSNLELAKNSNLKFNRGIIVNGSMETNESDVYACGDCAELNELVYGNWTAAEAMGKIAGANAVGDALKFENFISAFYFEGFDTKIFSAGNLNESDSTQQLNFVDTPNKILKKLHFNDNTLIGALLMGNIENSTDILKAISSSKTYNDVVKENLIL